MAELFRPSPPTAKGPSGPFAVLTELRCASVRDVVLMDVAVRIWLCMAILAHVLLDLRSGEAAVLPAS